MQKSTKTEPPNKALHSEVKNIAVKNPNCFFVFLRILVAERVF